MPRQPADAADLDDEGELGADDGDGADEQGPGGSGVDRVARAIRLVLAAIVLMLLAGVAGFVLAGRSGAPADDSVAAGLARDMIDHHAQAVDMATIIQGRTKDPAIRYLATDIALTQTNQMGQMQGWLNDWNLTLGRSQPQMAWMSAAGRTMQMGAGQSPMDPSLMRLQANGLMPGMATQAEVNQLRTLPPAEADRLFLRLMIAHHRGGIAMAQTAIAETQERVVVDLCRTIVSGQQGEIEQMTALLQQRS